MNKKHDSERGQALLLIVLGFVVLLGFTALAVDGSMLYSDRRYAQNAADASSLAGGGHAAVSVDTAGVTYSSWNCASSQISNAMLSAANVAVQRAADNGFTIDLDAGDDGVSDDGSVNVQCGVDTSGTFDEKYIDVTVDLIIDTQTSFAHFVYRGPLQNHVEAVTRVYPRTALVYGNAIVALNENPCSGNQNGLQFRGDLNLDTEGGGFWSNGCLDVDGGTTPRIYNGEASYFYGGNNLDNIEFYDIDGNPTGQNPQGLTPGVDDRIEQDAWDIAVPDCTGHTVTGNWIEGQSGLSGLYCVTGDISVNNAGESISGTDMTIVMLGGEIHINGGTSSIIAPSTGYTGSAIPGLAIYMPVQYYGPMPGGCASPTNELQLNGNALENLVGTILAPCVDISIEGGGTTQAFHSQIIGWNVNSGGTADINVVYDDAQQYTRPAKLDLYR
jgi:Flp pilus assembly protein TadG